MCLDPLKFLKKTRIKISISKQQFSKLTPAVMNNNSHQWNTIKFTEGGL